MVKIPPQIDWVLRVDGHTDQIPIKTSRFPSNWELSSARATGVVKYLLESGIEKERLKASGYADSRPKEGLDDLPLSEQRKANRRVVVSIRRY